MPDKPVVLAVGSNRMNLELLSQQLAREGFDAFMVGSLEEMDQAIKGVRKPALSLVDLSGFDQRIWERCEDMRRAQIPFIVISPQRSPAIQRDSMKHGASGLLIKPLTPKDLMEFVHTLLGE